MTASVRRPSLRSRSFRLRLALGTALAGGTLLAVPAARAQELPSGATTIVGAPATIVTDAAGKNMDVALVSGATVINWNTFNITGVSAADRSSVNFRQTLPNSVVVNRVTSTTPTTISDGRITTYATPGDATTRQNTTVWLLNRNGVLIGGNSAIDAGGFLGSTLDVCAAAACTAGEVTGLTGRLDAADPLPTDIRLFGAAASTVAVRVAGTSRITTNDALVLVGGAVEVQPGTTLEAGGDVNLVAATDVQVRRAGSPLVFQINAGTQVSGDLVSTGGGITGDSVVVAAARPNALAEALLSVGGTITARGVATGARGVVLLGGRTDPAIAIPGEPTTPAPETVITVAAGNAGPVGISSTAALTAQARDVVVAGTGAVTVAGPMSALGDYRVSGRSVTLGAIGSTVAQTAGAAVTVRGTGGDVAGLGTLTLQSNSAGATGGALTLASAGALRFGADTRVLGGDESGGGGADIRVAENSATTVTTFGTISGRSLGAIPATGQTVPRPLTLYGATTFGAVTLDRGLDLTIATAGAATGTLATGAITTGVRPIDGGAGVLSADDVSITTAGSAHLGAVESRTGGITVVARDGDVTGIGDGAGGFGYTSLLASVAGPVTAGTVGDGSVYVYAGRAGNGTLTATGTNGLARVGTILAGGDAVVLAQKIDVGVVRAGLLSAAPPGAAAGNGSATLHAYAHDAAAGAIDLSALDVSAGGGSAVRAGLDVQLNASAAGGTVAAGTLAADRGIAVLAGTGGAGALGTATIAGEVRAARVDATRGYEVTAGQVTLGTAFATVEQSSLGAVTIRSTAADITGRGTLTLQSNGDGAGVEPLTLVATRAIALDGSSRLFAGDGTALGNADLLVSEGATTTATTFGQVRARSLGSAAGQATVTLYGTTGFGTVDLDRSLDLTVTAGGGGEPGTITTGALTLGVHPLGDGSGLAVADNLVLSAADSVRLASVTSRTGSLSITAVDGDVTGVANAGGYDRVALSAARADAAASPRIGDGSITVLAGRNSGGALTATGTNGLALFGDATAGGGIRVDAQAVDAVVVRSDRGSVSVSAHAADGSIPAAAPEVLTLGTSVSGLATTLAAEAGSIRAGTIDAGRTAVSGLTTGAVGVEAYGNARLGVAAPTALVPGGVITQLGAVSVRSLHGDITGGEASLGRANLATSDGDVYAVADAQALGAAPVGLVQLGTVLARTSEAQAGATAAPARGNIVATGRVVDVLSAETTGATAGAGGSLYLQAREGTAADDAHVTLGTGLVGTTATLFADAGSLGGTTYPNGSVSVGSLEAGRNRLVGSGGGIALAGTVALTAANDVRTDTLASLTGSVLVTANDGDVRGYLVASGRPTIDAALAALGGGDDHDIADGQVTIRATSPLANRGVVTLGATRAGGDVLVEARTIDAAAQTVRSDRGSVFLTALSGDLTLGSAAAGIDVLLDASADTLSGRGSGGVFAAFLSAGRHVQVGADATATITDDVTAGLGGVGHYVVAAGGNVVLGSDATAGALADPDLQSAVDDVRITAGGDITAARRLTLRSNSAGVADGNGDADGVRELMLDAGGAIALSLPDGLSVADRDAVATRLIGGSAAAPQQSAVRVRAGTGTAMTLGVVTARALRSLGATPVATDLPDFAGRAGANPLYHDGDIRVGQVDVAESLGIFAYGGAGSPPRLLQIDGARSRTGNVELYATGELRGYQLTVPGAGTPLGIYIPTDLTAGGARVDVLAPSVLLGNVAAGAFAGIETTAGRLRVATVTTAATHPTADNGISLVAQTDLRLTSAFAARGDVVATAITGNVTGLAVPDNGTLSAPFAPVTGIEAADGNLVVSASGSDNATGLVAATALTAGSSETPGDGAPVLGNVSVIGQRIGVQTATARLGSLTLYARPGSAGPIATGVLLISGSAGTTTGITVDAGGISAPGDTNGSAVIGTLTAGTNALSGGAAALAGNATVTTAGNIRAGSIESRTGGITLTARDADVTGVDDGTGVFGRVNLTAATARGATAGALPIADGEIAVHAGRDASGALTATGTNGLARLGTLTAGGNVTILAQAIDATAAASANGAIFARAYAADGTVTGSASEVLVLGTATSGLGTILDATLGSARATSVTTGQLRNGTASDAVIDAALNIRVDTARSDTGNVTLTARDGDVTGLADAGGFGRATLIAATAAPASGSQAAVADGNVRVQADRDASGTLTATGNAGLAKLGAVTAGGDVTVLAQAIDALSAEATRGTITARAYAADGAVPGSASESLVLVDARSGLATTLTNAGGSIRTTTVGAGGDVLIDAARNVRLGTATTATGSMTVTARDGDVTGLAAGTGFDRAILSTDAVTGDIAVNAGRDSAGGLTATSNAGLAFIDTLTARRDATIQAQAIDARSLAAGRALTARAYATDGAVTAAAAESLLLDTAGAGAGITLASGGSIRATTVGAGQLRDGVTGDLVIDAARDVTLATGTSATGNVSVTARDGTLGATTLTAAIASIAQGTDAAIADGNVAIYAGRDASGALTATGSNGLARLGTVTAGNDVTVLAQRIDADTVQAAAVSATPLVAGTASGTATLHAYAHDTTADASDLSVATVSAGTASAPRRGLDVILIADAPGGTLRATTVNADRDATAFAGSGADGEAALAGEVRAGRSDPAGAYSVTAGRVSLGTAATPIEQSARGAVAITSTATDIVGLGILTLQSNSDGPGVEPLTLRAARGIVLTPESRLFAGTDTTTGTSDILVAEGAGATLTTFGQVRGRSLGGIPSGDATAPVPLTLYGATTFGTVDLDRSLDLTVVGALTTGPLTVGRYPASGVADTITISASGPTRFASLTSRTGGVTTSVTGAGQSLTTDGPIEASGAILLSAAQDVTTTTVTSSAGSVAIVATAGTAGGDRVSASGGDIDVTAGARAAYTTLAARDAIAVTAGTIGVTTATAGTSLAMTATGADNGAEGGEALVLTTGGAGTTASLTATTGSVRATTIDSGQARNGTVGSLAVTAARNVGLETARSATGNVTVTARDGTVAADTLTAAIASTPQGPNAAIADGNVAVYAGRDSTGALTGTGGNGLTQLGTVTAGNNVTVLAQKIDATTVQAAAVSATPIAAGAASGSATLTAYAHEAATGATDLRVGSVAAGTGSATRRGQDVILAASATGGTLQATTLDADRNVRVTAGSGTNGVATVSGAVRVGRVEPAGTYTVRAGQVTLGTAGQTIEQSAAAATSVTATAGGVSGLGTLTLQSNRDGTGAEALEVRTAGGSVVFDPASTLRGGQATANGSNVTVAATGTAANIDVGTVGAIGSTATLQADGSVTTRGPLTAATATLQAGEAITTNGTVTAPTVTFQTGTSATVNGALSATTATLRAVGRVTTNAPITATTLTVQSSQVSFNSTLNATTIGLYNQATTANRTRLGGTTSANETAFEVDQNEFNRITATNLLIGSGADDVSGQPQNTAWLRQDTDLGSLAIAAGTGSTAIKVLGTAAANVITVNGTVSINGGTASRSQNARVLQLGGAAANTTSEIGQIRIVNDGGATGNTGSIATGGGVLDLRAALILAGKQAFIDDVTRAGVDLNRNFISNPNSSLYGTGPNGYLTTGSPVDLITTGQLKLQFSNAALFQNTSRPGAIPTGVTITGASSAAANAQPLVLRSGSTALANGFALFGKFQPSATETFFSTQAALLGPNFISNGATGSNGVNPVSARLNGCLLSSASGGCLASSISQPTLNVFDVTRDQVLRGSDNLVVTFDPLVGSNNEALFGDIAAGDFELQQCPDGTTAVQCKPSGDAKP